MRGLIFVGGRLAVAGLRKVPPVCRLIDTPVHLLMGSPVTHRHCASPTTQTIYTNLIRVNIFSLQRIRKLRKVRPAVKAGLPLADGGNAAHAVAKQQLYTNWRGNDAGVDHDDVRVCGDLVFHFSLTPALRSLH